MKKAKKLKDKQIVEYSEGEDMGRAKKPNKQRIIEYSEDESDEEGDSDWAVETNETAKIAAGGENEPSARDKERTPKSVGGKRKQG